MSSSALNKTVMGGHQMLGMTVTDAKPPMSKEDLKEDLAATVALQPLAALLRGPKVDLSHTVAIDPATQSVPPRVARETVKMERPNLALLRTQMVAAVAPPAPTTHPLALAPLAPAPLAPAPLAPRAPSPGSASGIRAAVPAPFAHPYAAPPPPAPVAKPCSPTNDPRLIMLAEPNSPRAVGFRLLRDTVVTKGLPRVLAVSSPEAKEGKTTCALNLALSLAESRQGKLLLIDANFAAPALAKILGIDETATESSPEWAWCAPFTLSALTPCLHVATLTRRPAQASSYMDFATLARLLQGFQRAGYQNIILDTPALDNSPETSLMIQLSGGVILAVRSGRSKGIALRRAAEQIGPGKALGITLMDAPN